MNNKLFGIIGFIGFFLLTVSTEGIEPNIISIVQHIIQSVIGLLIMILSGHFAGVMSYQECSKSTYKCRKQGNIRSFGKQFKRAS